MVHKKIEFFGWVILDHNLFSGLIYFHWFVLFFVKLKFLIFDTYYIPNIGQGYRNVLCRQNYIFLMSDYRTFHNVFIHTPWFYWAEFTPLKLLIYVLFFKMISLKCDFKQIYISKNTSSIPSVSPLDLSKFWSLRLLPQQIRKNGQNSLYHFLMLIRQWSQ